MIGEASGILRLARGVDMVGLVAQSFRAPNIDDLSTLGRFDFGVEVPSPDLLPERAVTVEGGLRATGSRVAMRFTAYRTALCDLIDRIRSTYENSETWEGQAVYRKANVGSAVVHGAEAEGRWRISEPLAVDGHVTYTYGQNNTRDEPMRRIPPLHGLVRVSGQRRILGWEASLRWAGRQDRLSAGDIDDHRIADDGTPAWARVDLAGDYQLGGGVQVRGGVGNLLDRAYRVHGSGIDGPGRTFWIGLGASLGR